jgi:hypothetical protein
MAVISAVFAPAQEHAIVATLGATTSTAEIQDNGVAFGPNVIVQINCTVDMSIRFGVAGSVAAASAADYRIPANTLFTFETNRQWPSFRLFNLTAGSGSFYIQTFQKA